MQAVKEQVSNFYTIIFVFKGQKKYDGCPKINKARLRKREREREGQGRGRMREQEGGKKEVWSGAMFNYRGPWLYFYVHAVALLLSPVLCL